MQHNQKKKQYENKKIENLNEDLELLYLDNTNGDKIENLSKKKLRLFSLNNTKFQTLKTMTREQAKKKEFNLDHNKHYYEEI